MKACPLNLLFNVFTGKIIELIKSLDDCCAALWYAAETAF